MATKELEEIKNLLKALQPDAFLYSYTDEFVSAIKAGDYGYVDRVERLSARSGSVQYTVNLFVHKKTISAVFVNTSEFFSGICISGIATNLPDKIKRAVDEKVKGLSKLSC